MNSVQWSCAQGIATITLCAPQTRNALDEALAVALGEAVSAVAALPDLRVVLIRAEGSHFCVGADLAQLQVCAAERAQRVDTILSHIAPALVRLRELPALVVTAVQGAAAGGGLCLVTAADYVLAEEGTRFAVAYGAIGATPDLGASWFLPRLLGERQALRLALTNEAFDAVQAREFGLVQEVVARGELAARSVEVARRFAAGPAFAFAKTKALFQGASTKTLAEQLQQERAALLAAVQHEDFASRTAAFLARRKS